MTEQGWTEEEKTKLRRLHIDPIRGDREKLILLVEHFKGPNPGVYAVAEGRLKEPIVSNEFARKIRDLTRAGKLDWLLLTVALKASGASDIDVVVPDVPTITKLVKMVREFQSPKDTPHKRKIRKLSSALQDQMTLPWVWSPFFFELKPDTTLRCGTRGPSVAADKNGKISVELFPAEPGLEGHLWRGLRSHLESEGFSGVLGEIDNLNGSIVQYIDNCHHLMKAAQSKIGTKVKILTEDAARNNDKVGYKLDFVISAAADAVALAVASAKGGVPADIGYWSQSTLGGLWVLSRDVHGVICVARSEAAVKSLQASHEALRLGLSQTAQAKQVANLFENMEQALLRIRVQLQEFVDMERLPGNCDLCSKNQSG